MIGIYMYTNRLNGKRYVGKSTNIEARFGKHRRNAKDGRESYFYNALRKYGLEQFDFEVLEECSEEELNEREKHYIEKYNALYPNGYNLTPGVGEGLCLTYVDASTAETVSYDHTADGWAYNSTDKGSIPPAQ